MASNGQVDNINGFYYHAGSNTWADLTAGWSAFVDWSQNPEELIFESSVQDLGTAKPVIPECTIAPVQGSGYVEVLHGNSLDGSGDIVSPTTQGSDLYFDLDYMVSGYVSDTYTGFSSRYVQFKAHVLARNSDNTANITPVLRSFVHSLKQGFNHEYFLDVDTSTLAGTTSARTIPIQTLSAPVAGIFYSTTYDGTTSEANGKYEIKTISKSTPSFAVFDLDKFNDNVGVDTTGVDIDVMGYAELGVFENGSIRRTT